MQIVWIIVLWLWEVEYTWGLSPNMVYWSTQYFLLYLTPHGSVALSPPPTTHDHTQHSPTSLCCIRHLYPSPDRWYYFLRGTIHNLYCLSMSVYLSCDVTRMHKPHSSFLPLFSLLILSFLPTPLLFPTPLLSPHTFAVSYRLVVCCNGTRRRLGAV